MSSQSKKTLVQPALLAGLFALSAAVHAHAADKFKVTSVDCEMSWLWKHTPVVHYDIIDERRSDYETDLGSEYFQGAAVRTAEYCDRTSSKPETPLNPPRKIRGIWFESNDGQFKVLFDLDSAKVDMSVGVVNRMGDRHAADQRAAAQHQAQLEAIRTREAHALELKAAQEKAEQDKVVAEKAREKLFFDRKDVQFSRLGAEVKDENFTFVSDVRTNPFHFRRLGLAVVRTQFDRMMSEHWARFGSELAPVFVHIENVDRFTRSGETVMLAFKVTQRRDVERSYGSLPEIIVSMLKEDTIFGDYVGAYTCPADDCTRIFDVPPPPT